MYSSIINPAYRAYRPPRLVSVRMPCVKLTTKYRVETCADSRSDEYTQLNYLSSSFHCRYQPQHKPGRKRAKYLQSITHSKLYYGTGERAPASTSLVGGVRAFSYVIYAKTANTVLQLDASQLDGSSSCCVK